MESRDDKYCRCPPGGSGITDQSVEFWRDCVSFMRNRSEKHGEDVFNARFLLKTTTFLGSNRAVEQVLNDNGDNFLLGYKEYLAEIYGNVILFAEGKQGVELRRILNCLLKQSTSTSLHTTVSSTITDKFDAIPLNESGICLYSLFKRISSELMISLFLGVNLETDQNLVSEIIQLSIIHWHGIISVPVSIRGLGFSSSYRKALDAKAKLMEIIESIWKKSETRTGGTSFSFLDEFRKLDFESHKIALEHLVLLVTALIPKAMASILTSFVLTANFWSTECLGHNGHIDGDTLDLILLEICRLWPPFIGGRRIASRDVSVDGFSIPAGRPVVYISHAAHRDASIFAEPEVFNWKRWLGKNEHDKDKIFCFGAGSRSCLGKQLAMSCVKEVLEQFLRRYDWESNREVEQKLQCPEYKWLPVSRPKVKPLVVLRRRN